MKKIFKYTFPALIACPMMLVACSEWTEPESITLRYPSIEEQNPELYAQYLESLNDFKVSEHSIVIVSMNNLSTAPANQSQHLTALPDSVDYICLNNIFDVNEIHITEMDEVRKKGTKVVGLVDFDAIESAWQAILKKRRKMLPMWKLPRKGSNRKVMTNRRVKTKQQMKIRLLSMHGVSSNTVKKKQPDNWMLSMH